MLLVLIKVYRNLHRNCYSIVNTKTKRVFAYRDEVILKNAKFCVQEGGRRRVLKSGQKNVHAFVIGEWVRSSMPFPGGKYKEAYYNPHKTKKFINKKSKKPIERASVVLLGPGRVYYWK